MLPLQIARDIEFKRMHPITAWRRYTKTSIQALAEILSLEENFIRQIEQSNLHLHKKYQQALATAFDTTVEQVAIRYTAHYT